MKLYEKRQRISDKIEKLIKEKFDGAFLLSKCNVGGLK